MVIDLAFSVFILRKILLNIIIYYKVLDWNSVVGFVVRFNDLYSFISYKKK